MCLTIPKKVVEIGKKEVVVEDHLGNRQIVKTLVELAIGDFVLTKQNVVLEKMESEIAQEILNIILRR